MRQPFKVVVVLNKESRKIQGEKNMEDIVKGCIRSDSFARQKLYETFYGKMMATCMRYASDSQQAKDFLHDGFLKVFMNMEKFTQQGSLEGWIRRIMVNNILDHLKKNKKIYSTDNSEQFENMDLEEEDFLENENTENISKEEIMEKVQQLPTAYRTVFNLYVMENFSHKEIAEQLGINEGTSKSNLAKARIHLRRVISQMIYKNEYTGKR